MEVRKECSQQRGQKMRSPEALRWEHFFDVFKEQAEAVWLVWEGRYEVRRGHRRLGLGRVWGCGLLF